ncbi:MAG TPA: hypothetical protein VKG20_09150 [Methylomirabilota bacterium]|nr:hypothetical protein [Methylomirabilota bacterium]
MCENEYVAQMMVKQRIREAEARGAYDEMLRQALAASAPAGGGPDRRRRGPARLEFWRRASAAWVAQLALPKMWNRL